MMIMDSYNYVLLTRTKYLAETRGSESTREIMTVIENYKVFRQTDALSESPKFFC